MDRYIKIGEAAKILGISVQTLRRWEKTEEFLPDRVSEGGTRYYSLDRLLGSKKSESELTLAYARVSSQDQKKDLQTQAELLALYCTKQGWTFEVIQDLGSGMNYRKKGLQKLLDLIMKRQIKRLVLTHKDRLLRFGAELIFTPSFEKELVQDVLEIITVFSARMYGARSKKNRKLVETVQELL
ncbi:MAG: IS607 family transposase [Chlamydiae bacterium]|nr:IS607 family transposase [Chlamydiota bacterium]